MDLKKYKVPACMVCPVREKSLFNKIEGAELEEINALKRSVTYKKKQTIFMAGTTPFGVHIVHYGKIKLTKINSLGIEQIVGFAKQGDTFGYQSLLGNKNYDITAIALEPSIICFIPKDKILALIKSNDDFTLRLMEKGFTEFGDIANNYSDMLSKPLRQRIAMAILRISDTFGLRKDNSLDVALSREEIANLALTTTASCIRTLSDFNKEAIIKLVGKNIQVINETALRQEAEMY
ncbi:Crp/Fnr family transcriptional regulator [Fulvivirgaceae bacterium BMA10]|uniref:Crp/Fnr family transcriptional regulator n=1 Tax=Splendidivirga corallicola TaxID=3051826 RepID=A0ABT8KKU5_9BACT|nr:Crp/Fnr family transcriptional regulator [Fulvivirgaceae bacterium BMA10]